MSVPAGVFGRWLIVIRNINQVDVYQTITQAEKLKPNSLKLISVGDTNRKYYYASDRGDLTPDSINVLNTGNGGDTRWITNDFFEIQAGNNPGENEIAIFVGAMGIGVWPGTAPGGGQYELDVAGRGHFTQSTISSDGRFKDKIEPIAGALETVLLWNGIFFEWNEEYEKLGRGKRGFKFAGVIAQNIKASGAEELVSEWKIREKDPNTRKVKTVGLRYGVDYGRMSAYFIEAFKELYNMFISQQSEITDLKNQVAGLDARLKELEAK